MDTEIVVAIIATGGVVLSAVVTRPSRKAVSRIEAELRPNGGSSHHDLVERVAATVIDLQDTVQHIATEQSAVRRELAEQQTVVRDELAAFRETSGRDKEAAREEAVRMWTAIEQVARATPADPPPMRRRP